MKTCLRRLLLLLVVAAAVGAALYHYHPFLLELVFPRPVDEEHARAVVDLRCGRLDEAEARLRKLIDRRAGELSQRQRAAVERRAAQAAACKLVTEADAGRAIEQAVAECRQALAAVDAEAVDPTARGHLQRATQLLEGAVRFGERDKRQPYMLAYAVFHGFPDDDVQPLVDRALKLMPSDPRAHMLQGLVHRRAGRKADELTALETAYTLAPTSPYANYLLCRSLMERALPGDVERATAMARLAAPTNESWARNLARLFAAHPALREEFEQTGVNLAIDRAKNEANYTYSTRTRNVGSVTPGRADRPTIAIKGAAPSGAAPSGAAPSGATRSVAAPGGAAPSSGGGSTGVQSSTYNLKTLLGQQTRTVTIRR